MEIVDRLERRVTELLAEASDKANNTLARMVRAFHFKFDHPVRWTPAVPSSDEVRFRLRLITEEYLELLEACGIDEGELDEDHNGDIKHAVNAADVLRWAIARVEAVNVNLPEIVDAMADLEYVLEGTRAVFGVNGEPIMREVHRANLSKEPNGPDGKPVKGADWIPPDIRSALLAQGWRSDVA